MLRSLNSRLLISYVAVILICLLTVGLGLLVFVRTSPLWSRGTFLRLEATARATNAVLHRAESREGWSTQDTEHLLEQAADVQGVRILLLDRSGGVRFDTDDEWQNTRLRSVIRPAYQGSTHTQGVIVGPGGARWAYVAEALPIKGSGEGQIVAFLTPQLKILALAWFAQNLLPPLVRAGIVALVLSVLIAWLIARSVGRPLEEVAGAAQALAKGSLGRRAPVSGPGEVQSLAVSFNRMADQVEASQNSQRDFVANVSHELKTPLTSIQGFSQALLDGTASGPEGMAHAARVIGSEADRMRRMVDELLVLARLDAGQLEMKRDRVAIGPLLFECLDKLAPQAREADVDVTVHGDESLYVVGDLDRLKQVVINLLDNALAHTPVGGTVTLTARKAGSHDIEITVTDTGQGIPAAELSRVFERFYRVDRSRQRSRGAGLGLAIAKEIVEAHGGDIRAESVVGLGSEFIIRLPSALGSHPA